MGLFSVFTKAKKFADTVEVINTEFDTSFPDRGVLWNVVSDLVKSLDSSLSAHELSCIAVFTYVVLDISEPDEPDVESNIDKWSFAAIRLNQENKIADLVAKRTNGYLQDLPFVSRIEDLSVTREELNALEQFKSEFMVRHGFSSGV